MPEVLKIKELCKSLGLPESVFSRNYDTYYPVINPDHYDIDYINFKDIINKSWSIPLENFSVEDIELEQSYLKRQCTSSPRTQQALRPPAVTTVKVSLALVTMKKLTPPMGFQKGKHQAKNPEGDHLQQE